MSREIERIVYRQRFETIKSTEDNENPLTDTLNQFVRTPQVSFNFFSRSNYVYEMPVKPMKGDITPAKLGRDVLFDEKAAALEAHSKQIGEVGVQLAQSVTAERLPDGSIRLGFSPQDIQSYWKIIEEFHKGKVRTPKTLEDMKEARAAITQLATDDLYVTLPFLELRSRAGLNVARTSLRWALKLPNTRTDMKVIKAPHVAAHEIYKGDRRRMRMSHPHIIVEGVV